MKSFSKKKLIVIGGPTAVGKTAVAIAVAQHFDAEIISADSRQCYKELDIGVARPSPSELAAVPHHFIASHSIQQPVSAAVFEQYALQKLETLFSDNNLAVVCGGTGLYIQALCFGLDEIPDTPPELRESLRLQLAEKGKYWLQEAIKNADPQFYAVGDISNTHRLLRALEVVTATGKSILSYQTKNKKQRDFETLFFHLKLPRSELHQNINNRVDKMIVGGLVEEVKLLQPYQSLSPLNTVGYKEIFAYLNGTYGLPDAVEKIKAATRQYAKRQETWFNNCGYFTPISAQAGELIRNIGAAL